MKRIKLVLKATLFCLAAVLSMGVAQAENPQVPAANNTAPFGTNGNVILNYSFEDENTNVVTKIQSGLDTIPYWFSDLTVVGSDSGIEFFQAPGQPEAEYDGIWECFLKQSDGFHAKQTTTHVIQSGECFLVSVASKSDFVYTASYAQTNGYLTVVLYYGGTTNIVVGSVNGDTNQTLGTAGTPFFTNTFNILPSPASIHTAYADWTNYYFGVITNAIPTNAIGQPIGIDIWQSTTQYNSGADATKSWLQFDAVVVVPTNGIPPIAAPVTISPTNSVYGGETLTLGENAFGSLPITYQWQTDGGGGGTLTNINLGFSTNILTVVTPTNVGTYRFDVIITNSYGSNISAVVSYTVRGLAGPVLTQDAGTADWGPNTNLFAFSGGNVNLYAAFNGAPPVTNQWNVSSTGSAYTAIAGATNDLRTLTNVQSPSSVAFYRLGATNTYGSSNSTPAHLSVLADPGAPTAVNTYAYYLYTNHPWAYWRFEETNDTINSSMQAYDYSGHNFDATYGNGGTSSANCKDGGENILNGQYGPLPPSANGKYPGFEATNGCAGLGNGVANGCLTVPPLNLNTNTVTITMWIYPNSDVIVANSGLLMNRNGADAAGVGFGSGLDTNGLGRSMAELGYTWSTNSASSYGYHSHLYPLGSIWSFAAWVITPNNTTIYLYYVGGNPVKTNLLKAVQNNITNTPESFGGGTTRLGGDINYGNGGTFDGSIDEVAVFTNALVETNVQGIFLRALGLTTGVSPSITAQPQSVTLFQGQPLVETVGAGGIPSPTYQWQGGTNAIAGNWNSSTGLVGNIGDTTGGASHGVSGSTTATVTFTNYYSSFNYLRVIAANASGKVTSTWARVTLLPVLTNGLWTVNFSVTSTNNGGTGLPYVGRGVMGNNTYWNALSGPQLTNTTSLRDDGVTVSGISFGATSTVGNDSSLGGLPFDNALLDTFAQINGARAFVFNNIPNGKYNLALYGCVGSWVNRGIIFTVNGSIQSVTNVQDTIFALGDNLVMYTNISVLNQALTVSMAPVPATAAYTNSTEGDFNGAQIQLLQLGPQFTGPFTNNTLTWTGGGLYEATNIMGPWITNTATSPFVVTPTVPQKYFRVYNPTFPPN